MESVKETVARQWRPGALAFAIAFTLCLIAIWQRQERYTVVFSFSIPALADGIRQPSIGASYLENVAGVLRKSVEQRMLLRPSITHDKGTFVMIIDSVAADLTDEAEESLSAAYHRARDLFASGIDPTPLSARLDSIDARLDLIERTLRSTEMPARDEYELHDRAMRLTARREEVRRQLASVAAGLFSAPSTQVHRARQMSIAVLLLLGLVLSVFVAGATMVVADSFDGIGIRRQ